MLMDEFERDFESLEAHPARHASAVAMYCLVGQKCAQRLTDGHIPAAVMQKTFAAWPGAMVDQAVDDLVAIGRWARGEDGLSFVDWDLVQFTRAQEEERRARLAARQRDRRRRKKEESAAVVRDVARDVARYVPTLVGRDVAVPSASASAFSSPDPLPEPGREKPATAAPLAKNQVSSAHVQEWVDVLREASEKRGRASLKATRDQTWQLAEHVRDLARVHSVSYREAAQKLANAALDSAEKFPFSALRLDPYAQGKKVLPDYEAIAAKQRAERGKVRV